MEEINNKARLDTNRPDASTSGVDVVRRLAQQTEVETNRLTSKDETTAKEAAEALNTHTNTVERLHTNAEGYISAFMKFIGITSKEELPGKMLSQRPLRAKDYIKALNEGRLTPEDVDRAMSDPDEMERRTKDAISDFPDKGVISSFYTSVSPEMKALFHSQVELYMITAAREQVLADPDFYQNNLPSVKDMQDQYGYTEYTEEERTKLLSTQINYRFPAEESAEID